jgi:serine/threonine protein kinase
MAASAGQLAARDGRRFAMKAQDFDSDCSRNRAGQFEDPRVVEALDEYLAALEAGQKPNRQEFLSRHAAIADALAECLEGMEALHQASSASKSSDDRRDAGPTGMAGHPDWQPGTPLGDYRLMREIGRGGMGIVYEAEQLSLGRRIALKVLPFALTLDPKQLQRFKNEARAAAQLHHQHIVPVYAVGQERSVHFYAMQYIEGQSLAEVIHDLRHQEKPRALFSREPQASAPAPADATASYVPSAEAANEVSSAPRASETVRSISALATSYSADSTGFYRTVARLGIQAAEALEHAHEYGVIHRDIKPGNLMVDAHGHLWITDFGLAQFQTEASLTQSGDLLGTLRYMSPEQASGQRVAVDHRTDIYSLGTTLYELLTLHPPFEGNNRQTLLHQILNDEPQPPRAHQKSIPVELETIVLKALAKSPSERYATARDLADDLSRFLQDKPIQARRATAAQRLRKWARRHPSVVWAIVVLCLLTVAGSLVSAEIIRRKTETAYEREKQRAREAEERFELARQAVDGMFKLCEEELADKPFLDGLRRRLLQDYFLVYYQELIDRSGDNTTAQTELSATRERVLDILYNLADLQGVGQYQLLIHHGVVEDLPHLSLEQRQQIRQLKTDMDKRRSQPSIQRFWEDAKWMKNEAQRILTADQRQRLREIDLQLKGVRAFEEPEVIEALHLDASQRDKIRAIQAQEFTAAFGDCHSHPPGKPGELPPGGPPHLRPPKFVGEPSPFDGVQRQIEEEVLNDQQRRKWQELTGRPFRMYGKHRPGGFGPPRRSEPRP